MLLTPGIFLSRAIRMLSGHDTGVSVFIIDLFLRLHERTQVDLRQLIVLMEKGEREDRTRDITPQSIIKTFKKIKQKIVKKIFEFFLFF